MNIEALFPIQNQQVRFLLGLYISRKRREADASITEMAAKMDVTPQTFKRIETGRMKITPELFYQLQDALPMDANDLNEIRRIASVSYINDLSKVLVPNYPA